MKEPMTAFKKGPDRGMQRANAVRRKTIMRGVLPVVCIAVALVFVVFVIKEGSEVKAPSAGKVAAAGEVNASESQTMAKLSAGSAAADEAVIAAVELGDELEMVCSCAGFAAEEDLLSYRGMMQKKDIKGAQELFSHQKLSNKSIKMAPGVRAMVTGTAWNGAVQVEAYDARWWVALEWTRPVAD